MKIFDNVHEIVREDMAENIKKGSKVSVAAACFSMYAYQELSRQLQDVESFVLFLLHQHLLKKNMKNRKENFIFQG